MTAVTEIERPITVHFYYAVLMQVVLSAVFLRHIPIC